MSESKIQLIFFRSSCLAITDLPMQIHPYLTLYALQLFISSPKPDVYCYPLLEHHPGGSCSSAVEQVISL